MRLIHLRSRASFFVGVLGHGTPAQFGPLLVDRPRASLDPFGKPEHGAAEAAGPGGGGGAGIGRHALLLDIAMGGGDGFVFRAACP